MPPEPSPDELERELAARLAARDEERARTGAAGSGSPGEGLPPEAAARLQGAIEGLARLHARWPARPLPEGVPWPFDKFLIERELGRGGHGIVFLALDPDLDRRVALKIPRPELLDEPDWRRRFLREARALARLDHPGIVDVLEVGEVDGVCYIASAYCDGPNLTEWLKARGAPLDSRAAARVARHVAEAIGHAHARGVIHRDLKPRNILMQPVERPDDPDDQGARPRVTDFGLAKLIEAEGELTRTGAVLGTPRYMAPEQRQARHDLVGPPADVYPIGVILDEMLSGRPAAQEDGPDAAPPAPDASRARPIPRALRAIVDKCLELEPARRYAGGGQLAADLDRFLKGGPVHAARWSPRTILAHASRRPALALAILATASLLAAVLILGRRPPERLGSPRAVAPETYPVRRLAGPTEPEKRYVADLRLVAGLVPSPADLDVSTYNLATARSVLDRYRPPAPESDLRTWEWYYFQGMLHGERATLPGHRDAVYHLEYARDGTRLVSSGEDGVRMWSAATGALEWHLREHSGCVNWAGFSSDGTRLVTAGDDRTVRVWGAADGRRLLPHLVHRHKVVVVFFTPDGRHLIACDRGGIVTTWDSRTGAAIRSDKVSSEPIEGMDLSPDGSILAVAASHEMTLWDYPAMKRRMFPIPIDSRSPPKFECVAFSHDGRRLATSGGSDQQIRVWDTQNGRLCHVLIHHGDDRVLTVAFSLDDRLLLSTGSDEAARLWDVAGDGGCVGLLAGHGAWVWSGAFAPDGRTVATGGGDGAIKLWTMPHRGALVRFERLSFPVLAIAYTRDGTSLRTATRKGAIVAWDPATGREQGFLLFRTAEPTVDAAFAPGADRVAVVDAEGTLTVGSPLRARPDLTLERAAAPRPCLTFSSDGQRLAYVAADGAVMWLDPTKRAPRPSGLGSSPSAPTCLAFAPHGRLVAGDAEGRLFAFPKDPGPAAGAAERGHRGGITALAISADGSLCATGGEDASIVLWDARALRIRARLGGHQQAIDAFAFTPNGRTLVSIADRVQLWNVATAQPTIGLAGGLDRSSASPGRLAISTDGRSIATLWNQGGMVLGRFLHGARPGPE